MPIGSVLKAGIKALPEDTVVPAQSVPNLLKKQGVKDEEVQFSGVELPKEGKVTKSDLEKMESERLDIFDVEEVQNYNWVSLAPGRGNPTYREKVTTYSEKGATPSQLTDTDVRTIQEWYTNPDNYEAAQEVATRHNISLDDEAAVSQLMEQSQTSRYTSSHFGEIPNYLMHSRIYDDTLDGVPTRVVQEIQSDLHQAGRQQGYGEFNPDSNEAALHLAIEDGDMAEANDIAGLMGIPDAIDLHEWAEANPLNLAGIPKSPFEKTWLRKGLEREISDAIDEGREQIAIPISGAVDDLKRTPGVQKWYETVVKNTAQKLAKSAGADFEMKTVNSAAQGEVTYAVIKPKLSLTPEERIELKLNPGSEESKAIRSKAGPNFALYASPGASAFIAYSALKAGYSQEDVEAKLTEEGYTTPEIQDILINTQKIADAYAAGYKDEEIKSMLEQQEVQVRNAESAPLSELEPPTPNRFTQAYSDLMGAEEMGIRELLAKMEVVYPDDSFVTTNIAGFFGNEEAKRVSDASIAAQRERIIAEAANRGLKIRFDVPSGEWMAESPQGEVVVTPEWYRSFWESKGEFTLGFTGGTFAAAQAIKHAPGGLKGKLLAGAGVVGATAVAAIAGTELDYLHSAMTLQQDFEADAMARKALTAAELSVIGDAAALGLIKVAGKSWNGMRKAVELVRGGFYDRAGTALKETFFITDASAQEMVKRLQRVADVPPSSDVDKAITATALMKPGAEQLVAASVHTDPRASRAVVKAIDDRAQDVLSSTKALAGEDVGRFIRDEFEGYTSLVRSNFERVKAEAGAAPKGNNFKFDYNKLAIDPVLEDLGKNIENPDLMFKFTKQAQKIRDMSNSRRLGDLVELRKLVNEFRYNKRISSKKDYQRLDEIKAGIDKAIQQGAYATMENPQRWLTDWKRANKEYSEMKALQKNVLARVLNRPGVSEKAIGQALAKYAPALDGTFVEVMAQLPKKSRQRAEGAVLNNLAEKFTVGATDGVRATNFPQLSYELDQITFTSPEARKMKKAINELSNVFKNDMPLSQSAGGIQVTQFAQALTTDPVAKAKFAFASHMFHYVRSLAPTASGRASALINKTAELLENPVNSKTIRELTEMIDGEVNVMPEFEEMIQKATMQKAAEGGVPKMKLYGDGNVLAMKGSGKEQSIAMQRIASTEESKAIAEAAGINPADRRALDYELHRRGYLAVQLGQNKVRLLK